MLLFAFADMPLLLLIAAAITIAAIRHAMLILCRFRRCCFRHAPLRYFDATLLMFRFSCHCFRHAMPLLRFAISCYVTSLIRADADTPDIADIII